jgi:hypothetical protein
MNVATKSISLSLLVALVLAAVPAAFGQAATSSTTLSAAIGASDTSVTVASATGILAAGNLGEIRTNIYVDREDMAVLTVTGTVLTVIRGISGSRVSAHVSGAKVWHGPPNYFNDGDYVGACTASAQINLPRIAVMTGNVWSCLSGIWTSFGDNSALPTVGTTVASATTIVPTGTLFTVSGTTEIVTITVPAGILAGQSIAIIPSGVCTFTAAGNIALAGSCVVNKLLTFTWSGTKWIPSYIA